MRYEILLHLFIIFGNKMSEGGFILDLADMTNNYQKLRKMELPPKITPTGPNTDRYNVVDVYSKIRQQFPSSATNIVTPYQMQMGKLESACDELKSSLGDRVGKSRPYEVILLRVVTFKLEDGKDDYSTLDGIKCPIADGRGHHFEFMVMQGPPVENSKTNNYYFLLHTSIVRVFPLLDIFVHGQDQPAILVFENLFFEFLKEEVLTYVVRAMSESAEVHPEFTFTWIDSGRTTTLINETRRRKHLKRERGGSSVEMTKHEHLKKEHGGSGVERTKREHSKKEHGGSGRKWTKHVTFNFLKSRK